MWITNSYCSLQSGMVCCHYTGYSHVIPTKTEDFNVVIVGAMTAPEECGVLKMHQKIVAWRNDKAGHEHLSQIYTILLLQQRCGVEADRYIKFFPYQKKAET